MIYADWPVATAIGELIYCMRIHKLCINNNKNNACIDTVIDFNYLLILCILDIKHAELRGWKKFRQLVPGKQ